MQHSKYPGFYNVSRRYTKPGSIFKQWFKRITTLKTMESRTFLKALPPGDYYVAYLRNDVRTGHLVGNSFQWRFVVKEDIKKGIKIVSEYKNSSQVKKTYHWVFVTDHFFT